MMSLTHKKSCSKYRRISFLLVLLAIITSIILFRSKYVIIGNIIYAKSTTAINGIHLNQNNVRISELNKCSNIEYLSVWGANDTALTEMKAFDKLTVIDIFNSEISTFGIAKLNKVSNLNDLLLVRSYCDLSGIKNDSLRIISMSLCEISNITDLYDCISLTSLYLKEVIINDKLVEDAEKCKEYALKDSSDFSALDNIKELHIYNTVIEDISGIVEMDSLEVFYVSKGALSDDNRNTLENNGIRIIEEESAE